MNPEWDVLLIACKDGDPNKVRSLLVDKGIPVSHANAVGQSAMHVAGWWGWSEVLSVLCDVAHSLPQQPVVRMDGSTNTYSGGTTTTKTTTTTMDTGDSNDNRNNNNVSSSSTLSTQTSAAYQIINAQNVITGATPLHCIVQSSKPQGRRVEAVQVLLQSGADPSIADFGQMTPLDHVVSDRYQGSAVERAALVRLLEEAIAVQSSSTSPSSSLSGPNLSSRFQQLLLDPDIPITSLETEFAEHLTVSPSSLSGNNKNDGSDSRNDSSISSSSNSNNSNGNSGTCDSNHNHHILMAYSRQGDTPLLSLVKEWKRHVDDYELDDQAGEGKNWIDHDFYLERIEWLLRTIEKTIQTPSSNDGGGDRDITTIKDVIVVDLPHRPAAIDPNSQSTGDAINQESNALDLLCEGILELYKDLVRSSDNGSSNVSFLRLNSDSGSGSDGRGGDQKNRDDDDDDNDDNNHQRTSPYTATCRTVLQHWSKLALTLVNKFGSKPYVDTTSHAWFEISRRNYMELAHLWWGPPPVAAPVAADSTDDNYHVQNRHHHLNISPLHVTNRQGMSTLHFAARSGNFDMVKWLLSTEQQVLHPSSSLTTTSISTSTSTSTFTLSSSSSWLLNHQDQRGKTALDAARANNKETVVDFLIQIQGQGQGDCP